MKDDLYTVERESSLICIISSICSDGKCMISKGLLCVLFNTIINTHSVRLSSGCLFDVCFEEPEVVVDKLLPV